MMFQVKTWFLQTDYPDLPSHEYNAPIEIHQNIQHVYFNPDHLNIIRGAVERDPVHVTVYCLTLNRWPDRIQDIPLSHVTYGTPEMS